MMTRAKRKRGLAALTALALVSALQGAPSRPARAAEQPASRESEKGATQEELNLTVGEDSVVDLPYEANLTANGISIGNPALLKTTLARLGDDKTQLVFKALKPGSTTVTVRHADGTIRSIFRLNLNVSNLGKMVAELEDLLRDIEGIKIRIVGQSIVVDGEVIVPADYGRLVNVLEGKNSPYQGKALNLTTLSPVALNILGKRIQTDVSAFAPNVKTRVVNGQIWLEGSVDNYEQAKRAGLVANLYLPEVKPLDLIEKDPDKNVKLLPKPRALVQNFIVINPPPPRKQAKLVRVTVHFVELSKDYSKLFGFKWQPGFTADPQITIGAGDQGPGVSGTSSFTATISSLFPKLRNAQDAGYARVLKTGTLIVRSGQPASLVDKTQIPFVIMGPNGQPASSSAGVGLSLAVTPTILGASEDIQMDINMTQQALAGRSGNSPITSEHTVKTKLYVKSAESAALAGVTSSDVQTQFNKDDPNSGAFRGPATEPLFTLLRSKSYSKKKSEFVIFVTPQIVESASEGTKDLKKNFRIKVN